MRDFEVYRGHNTDVGNMQWHPHHESLLLSGGYNGSLIYWIVGTNQAPHTQIADAHRQSIDIIAWHPAGHFVATASHDGILKFWGREPPGSKLLTDKVLSLLSITVHAYNYTYMRACMLITDTDHQKQ